MYIHDPDDPASMAAAIKAFNRGETVGFLHPQAEPLTDEETVAQAAEMAGWINLGYTTDQFVSEMLASDQDRKDQTAMADAMRGIMNGGYIETRGQA